MSVKIRVSPEDFSLDAEMAEMRQAHPSAGALASFVGVVRNHNDGDQVSALTLEHYPKMTEKSLAEIIQRAQKHWPLEAVTVIHRVGPLKVSDQIVLVLVASAHRHAAFEACEYIMDWLKTQAPFWKKEMTQDGERWVDARESDEHAKSRWEALDRA